MITGKTLQGWGFTPGKWFGKAIEEANRAAAAGADTEAIQDMVRLHVPPDPIPLQAGALVSYNIHPVLEGDAENLALVKAHMAELSKVPTLHACAVMPDACPSGGDLGTVPVGAVVAAKDAIHPGFHSADICCSMAITTFRSGDPKVMLDAGMKLSHFGGGGRPYSFDLVPPEDLLEEMEGNPFTRMMGEMARRHFGTQGDGNHFFYVGHINSTGDLALVTHHGSRKPGSTVYQRGMDVAERFRREICPEAQKQHAWIPASTREGEDYWAALQLLRRWTKANHFAIHDLIARSLALKPNGRFWNEHNFVFQKPDGLFYHAKGATPAFPWWGPDATEQTLIPLNMAEPILIAEGLDNPLGLGFAPHGAGRNMGRGAFMRKHAGRTTEEMVAAETHGLDARFFCGVPDVSELPSAYKDAGTVYHQITHYELARIVDSVLPYGSIMAGDWQRDAPWRKKKEAKAAGPT
jgi:tRNA-splicing ligase RtcB